MNLPDGTTLEGNFVNGVPHGHGVMKTNDG